MVYSGLKALIMGIGLHGGGLESARFLIKRGCEITVTDLRDEKTLLPSIEKLDTFCGELKGKPVKYILGKHEIDDFKNADIVVKNPAVRNDSIFLQSAKKIETDISLFLQESPAGLFAVTGTKGKSCTASALCRILSKNRKKGKAFLGGNITVSPLVFLDELEKNDDVVLELSSFQLGDLKNRKAGDKSALLKPSASVITAIMSDHQDRYASMNEYIDDKRNIYFGQDSSGVTVAGDDIWGKSFLSETKGRPLVYSHSALKEGISGGWLDGEGFARLYGFPGISDEAVRLVPSRLLVPGEHQKINMLAASLAAFSNGIEAQTILAALEEFRGIEHRLEFFHEAGGVRFFNDSAATIPEAACACIEAFQNEGKLVLVTGGTDKNLDFSFLAKTAAKAKKIILLAGSGSEKLKSLLNSVGVSFNGPFNDLEKAVSCAVNTAEKGDIVALSPGCASFGMFLNEFDRGRRWKEAVLKICSK
ncbi:MAG: UDP-N-acetylmuramoyl-L-alanine--D-glutamate ligase [Treponema sp.]|nr:UDP-N-acetylmuramoyl-L-alanine--D-glutamate ligase [Treponema sp.]MCL2272253.1 UDP-N-acetylmuramoyl-L-alanine--D-glutamate ligase [Treponema sp.]